MRRRELLMLLGGVAACPLAARGQPPPAMPVVGFLGIGSAASEAWRVAAFRQGLNESGYVEGRNVEVAPVTARPLKIACRSRRRPTKINPIISR
jgi:putative tryptophan/tyrosine transport system substrate-binding protein